MFGPRCSIRPVLGQAEDGTWQVEREAVQHDDNAIDDLVRLALEGSERVLQCSRVSGGGVAAGGVGGGGSAGAPHPRRGGSADP